MVLVVKNPPANAGDLRDTASIPGLGRSPGGGHGNPLQYSCLENPMNRGVDQLQFTGLQESDTIEVTFHEQSKVTALVNRHPWNTVHMV